MRQPISPFDRSLTRRTARATRICVLSAALALVGCDDGIQHFWDASLINHDAGPPPPSPSLNPAPPSATPWPLITVQGSALDARRVLIRGGQNPLAVDILPGQRFCADVPLTPGAHELELVAQGLSGDVSPPTRITVAYDPGAAPSFSPRCDGSDPRGCIGAREICDNHRDDDCDGRVDQLDEECSGCTNDILESNDQPELAPRIPPEFYPGLMLCPGDQDNYRFFIPGNQTLEVSVLFSQQAADIDLTLFAPDDSIVATANSVDDDEVIVFHANIAGDYRLLVYAGQGGAAQYTMIATVHP